MFTLLSNLISFATSLATLPFRMLAKNFVGTVILFGLVYIFFISGKNDTQPVPRTTKAQTVTNEKGQPVPIIEPVSKEEDGNSRFSDDLLSQMAPAELRYYSTIFYWVMENQDSGYPYRWAHYNIDGIITPFSFFKNNHGHECRRFKETLKVHSTRQTLDGLACRRVEGGWCRLRFDSTPLCGIAGSGNGIFDDIGRKLQNIF